VVDDPERLEHLLARGLFVDMRVFEAQFRPQASDPGAAPVVENRYDPFAVHESLKTRLNRLLREVLGASAKPAEIVELADQVRAFAERDVEAAVASSLLDRHEEVYPVGHSLSAAVLCAAIAHRMEWPEARQSATVCAALTMNLGMLEYHQRLHRQATPLTAPQREQLQQHPDASVKLLQAIGVTDPVWLDAIREHHDKADGSGYHHAASSSEPSQLLRIADVFDARSNARADRKALAPAQVIRTLFVDEGKGPCAAFANALVKLFGLYPPGSFVRLANGEQAVVFRHGESPTTPVVAAVTTSSGSPLMKPVRRDTGRKDFTVAGTLVPDKPAFGYDLAKLWITKT
jgi:HD-GYP domain-containing protein (c-di-GMP phosphodiesterase class II)